MQRYQTFQFAMLVAVAVCGSVASAATQITLRESAVMTSSVVRLGDVAEITCGDEEQARRLAALPLMPAPAAGAQRFLRKREIEDLLAAHGVDLRAITLAGAPQVTIAGSRTASAGREVVSGKAIGKFNRHAALLAGRSETPSTMSIDSKNAAVLADGVRTLISNHLDAKTAETGTCDVTCDVAERHLALLAAATSRPVCEGGMVPWTGRQRFEISFTTAAGAAKFPVYAEVTPPTAPVAVAIRPLARGDVFTAADVELQNVDYFPKASERRVAVNSIEMLIGMEARQHIPAGSIVFTEAVQSPVLVKRGELISVSSQSSGIRVRTTARAQKDGSQGQLILVESLATKEKYDARVIGPGEAAIVAITPPAVSEPARPIETARRP